MQKDLIDLSRLSKSDIDNLLSEAKNFKQSCSPLPINGQSVCSIFYENSTRTRVSFELATKRLGCHFINVDVATSSEKKGEAIIDTIATIHAMGVGIFILRHQQPELIEELSKHFQHARFINAGNGMAAHPTQALLDILTITENKGDISSLRCAIVGDIRHSRVANSLIQGLQLMGIKEIRLCAPIAFKPDNHHDLPFEFDLKEALADVDVIYTLRVQNERFNQEVNFCKEDYQRDYRIDENAIKLANSSVVVMHPGPVNRGVEIASEVCDSDASLILKQVENGVYMRMAVLKAMLT